MEHADAIANSVLKIVAEANPAVWFIENPVGHLQHRDFMQPLQPLKHECTFCMYGTDYRKATDIWSNIE